ncbi:hypothetical protein [Streptomyces sp. t39]|uniref:hypothetical protein n=1 Tax=Streptomyces sp. t39 TaxID=1828156 RepID=UPI0011CD3B74|nr:hypothetical protein [Streptomyces sp. t39]TXS35098.1 hypothetical protein EAO77_38030 [Streptomyces sp. t39]
MIAHALGSGLLLAWLLGQAYYPLVLRSAPAEPEPMPEPGDPRLSPDWCHAHDVHRDDEEH